MSVLPVGIGSAEEGDYQIERSLRFNFADSAHLNRTPGSASNRTTWTYSYWFKGIMLKSGVNDYWAFSAFSDGNNYTALRHQDQYAIELISFNAGSAVSRVKTQKVFRDPSAWNHIVVTFDTSNATQADRVRIYHNGVRADITSGSTYPGSGSPTGWVNNTNVHYIGRLSTEYFDGYMTEVHFVDGSALDPTSFGEFNEDTGVWQPKAYSGSYGTNGFYLDFADNSGMTSTTLGADSSGNGNNWTPNNFSVTAGAGNDSLVDSPTRYGTDTGAGGEVRGNYATWNALANNSTLTNGNLQIAGKGSSVFYGSVATTGITSGKWYWEITNVSNTDGMTGIIEASQAYAFAGATPAGTTYVGYQSRGYAYHANGNKYNNASSSAYGATYTTNDVIGVAFDADAGTLVFYKNGVSQGTAYTVSAGYTWFPADNVYVSDVKSVNFGQRPFAYTAPSGFLALVTTNLPEPTIADGGEYFNTVTYAGTSSEQTLDVGFQPDFSWFKVRDLGTQEHALFDVLRGNNRLTSDTTNAEEARPNDFTGFTSNGVTIKGTATFINNSSYNYVAWNWKANGAGVSNTDGTITSTVSANTTSGFSIVTYTGNGTDGATIGHGLGVVPKMVIVKIRSKAYRWMVYFQGITSDTQTLILDTTAAVSSLVNPAWSTVDITSSVFGLGNNADTNESGSTFVAYCFAPVPGFSSISSYVGNGSTNGPFVYTGFRPKYVMIKSSTVAENWNIEDTSRSTYNQTAAVLYANNSRAEETSYPIDILSNGFKIRSDEGGTNSSGATFIYMAFAENPFQYSLAR